MVILNHVLPYFVTIATTWLCAFVVIVVYLIYAVKKKQSHWARKGIKFIKPKFLLGSIEVNRTKSFAEKLVEMYAQFPDERYVGIYQFLIPTLMIKDLELIKQITVKEFDHLPNHRNFGNATSDKFWNKNLFASRDEKWRDLRSTLSPSFTSNKMRIMFALIEEIAQQFVEYHKQQNEEVVELEMKDAMSRYTNDVIANTAFGLKVDSLQNRDNEFYVMGKQASDFGGLKILKFFISSFSPTMSELFKIKIVPTYVERFFSDIIESTIKMRKEKKIVRPDMIHLLMEAQKGRQSKDDDSHSSESFATVSESELTRNKSKQEITDEDINAQAFIFFLAGFETVSTHIAFTFYELAVNPDVQNRLRNEINSVEGTLCYETLLGLKYLDMVISESLRKWPPAVVTDREVAKDVTIQPQRPGEVPLRLEKGSCCWLPIFALHNDPKFYPDPNKFDPERFSEDNRHKIVPSSYIPFGSGPRNCIGSRFALLESKLIVFHVLKSFEVVPVARLKIPVVIDPHQINLTPTGLVLGFKKNQKC